LGGRGSAGNGKKSKLKVLFIVHNHPSMYPGGTEAYALDVYREMGTREEIEPVLLARIGPTPSMHAQSHPATPFGRFDLDGRQYWMYSDSANFDWLHLTSRDKSLFTFFYRDFLLAEQPDVVHLHHLLYLGPEILRVTKDTLPDAAIVYSLHDYHPICHRDGVMVRTRTEELCDHASPSRCNGCFPQITPEAFFLRKRFLQAHFEVVDLFLSPSHFLREKYLRWGIAPEKIRFSEHGRPPPEPVPDTAERGQKNVLGYFGQLNPHKGIDVLLRAMQILAEEDADVRLRVHGANLEWQSSSFRRQLRALAELAPNVTWVGRYQRQDLGWLMSEIDWVVVPSLWWENSPVVIQEAFQYGKPVICSGIGAMQEKVKDGVNGLHFRRGDPQSLAGTIRRATESEDLWESLHAGVPNMRSIEDDVESLIETYSGILAARTP
jgi:glycosyltransferase involved in cell wall biosynthesis